VKVLRLAPLGVVAWLVVLWLLLWGDVSVANIASGILVALALLAVFPLEQGPGPARRAFRPVAIARLAGYFLVELVISSLLVARVVVSRNTEIRTGVIRCPLLTTSDGIVTVLCNMIALSPGTMMVEVLDDAVYVHALVLRDVERVRHDVGQLQALIIAAFDRPPPTVSYPEADR
jgi:multicomponent Na+:H+ antiporter subunit E